MKHVLIARLLMALSLAMSLSVAMARQEPSPQVPVDEVDLPAQTDSRPESETKLAMMASGTRGQLLYENHCRRCHTSVVHVRSEHKVQSMEDLQHAVNNWASELKLPWSTEEINDVVKYLNRRYYDLK